jgi:hypothetical protein
MGSTSVKESKFEQDFCRRLRNVDKDVIVVKLTGISGIPDRIVLYHDKFVLLEFKRSKNASHRPLQDWYIDHFDGWGLARFVYPENGEEVFSEVLDWFGLSR